MARLITASACCLLLLLLAAAACSTPGVGLEGHHPPTFKLSGRDRLRGFEVYEVRAGEGGARCLCLVWSVGDYSEKKSLDELGSVRCGEVPPGWEQSYPPGGAAAPPLVPERTYQYWLNVGGKVAVMREFGIYGGKLTHTLME